MPYRQPGSPYWYVSYTDASGKRIRASAGTADFKEAKAIEAKRRVEAHRERQWGDKPARTFDELMLAYLRDTEDKKSHSRDITSARALTGHFGGRVINDLSPEDIADYKRQRLNTAIAHTTRKVKKATVAKELLLLSAAINHANHEWGWELPNIVAGRVPKATRGKLRWLTHEEASRLIAAAASMKRAPHLVDFVELGVATGMRRDEILELEWSRVDFTHRKIYFGPDDQKAGIPGSIPLNNWAVEVLRRRLAWRRDNRPRSPWVFPSTKGKKGERIQSVKKAFWSVTSATGLQDVTPHTLRHTFASWLVQKGVPLRTVKDLCRHKDIRTTMIYAHLAPDQAAQAIGVLDRINADSVSKSGLNDRGAAVVAGAASHCLHLVDGTGLEPVTPAV